MTRNFMQRSCPRCNRPLLAHGECPVTDAMLGALRAYALDHGKRWKADLCELWMRGEDDGLLRQIRNIVGPSRLYKINLNGTWKRS